LLVTALLHPAAYDDRRLLAECDVRRTRRSGPGGQHRNKVETAVVITHMPSGVRGEASERRSQEQNRQEAIFRLRVNLALAVRCESDGSPSELWMSRLRGHRIEASPTHDDFPALLAEALDVLAAAGMDVGQAAGRLRCTASQLTKLLKHEPRALQMVNERRVQAGLRRLT
jgi:protein subunit release factor A